MKLKFPVLIAFFFVSGLSYSYGQGYKPTLGQTNEWYYAISHTIHKLYRGPRPDDPPDDVYNYNVKFYTKGDSVVKGLTYKKLYYSAPDYDFTNFYWVNAGKPCTMVREDSVAKKIFVRGFIAVLDTIDRVLYDFNLQKGDTLKQVYNGYNMAINGYGQVWGEITKIDTAHTTYGDYKYYDFMDGDQWFEGLGSSRPFYYVAFPPDRLQITHNGVTLEHATSVLTCAFKDGIQIYANGLCGHPSAIRPGMNGEKVLSVFENSGNIYINNQGSRIYNANICVYDITGRLFQTGNCDLDANTATQAIHLNAKTSKGIYLIKVEAGEIYYTQKIEIKENR